MDDIGAFLVAYQTTIGTIGINALLALSVWLTLYTGQLTLGNAAFAGIAAYSSALLTLKAGLPFPLALAAGAMLAAAVSVPLGATVFRLRGVYLAIATLAFGEVVRVAILAIPITGRGQGLVGIPPKTELWHVFASLVVIAYVCARLRSSSVGRAWAAIREDEVAAASQGIPVRRYQLVAFVLGALIAGWAGGLAAHFDYAIQPDEFGFARAVQILVFAVVGGIPNVFGPILGALLFTALPAILQPLQEYRDIFQGAILVLVIVFLPRGLVTVFELRRTARLRTMGAEDVA
ncbi:MAG TPA: branched-chain amino acid ABC transporter permease [Candidatus Limnocylindria bacterium]|nr:branched-chain amino acid ABC transporter permease [Candidatus Limnocylindria bacterium]